MSEIYARLFDKTCGAIEKYLSPLFPDLCDEHDSNPALFCAIAERVKAEREENARLKAELAEAKAELEQWASVNDVVCGDHWHGLHGESVDGSDGCPWCLAKTRMDECVDMEHELTTLREALPGLVESAFKEENIWGDDSESEHNSWLVSAARAKLHALLGEVATTEGGVE